MHQNRFSARFVGVIVGWAWLASLVPASAQEFKADMTHHVMGQSRSGPIFVKGSMYRMEQKEDGQQVIVIVNQDTGVIRALMPDKKQYRGFPPNDPSALMNDPFQSVKYMVSPGYGATSKRVGTETVNGYICDKYVLLMLDTEIITQWVSQKLKFPLKILNHTAEDTFTELKNIQESPVVDTLFQLPGGYTKMKEPGAGAGAKPAASTDWTAKVSSSPVVKPPYQQEMSAGEMIRVKVEAGKELDVSVDNGGDAESIFVVVPFLHGRRAVDPSISTNFRMSSLKQSSGTTCRQTPEEADEILIRVEKGKIVTAVKQALVKAAKVVAAAEELRVPLDPRKSIRLRVANQVPGESVCTFFFQKGRQISDSVAGSVDRRTSRFGGEGGGGETFENSFQADEFVLRVAKGQMLARVSQP